MERAIGEIFQDGEVTLKVVEDNTEAVCKCCFYLKLDCSTIQCTTTERSDKTSVIFVKQ